MTWNICVLKLTSSNAAGDFIIIFDVARVLLHKGCTRCAFYESLWTSVIRRCLLFFVFNFCGRVLPCGLITAIIWHGALRILIYLAHLCCLLFHFHLLIQLMLFYCLTEILIHVFVVALAVRTGTHALLLVYKTCRRFLFVARSIRFIARYILLWFRLSLVRQRSHTLPIVSVFHLLAFTIWWLHV